MNRRFQHWTEEEIEVLKRDYPLGKTEELSLNLGRSLRAIGGKAENLGISKSLFWTKKEIQLLKDKYPVTYDKDIPKLFPNRTLKSICAKAHRMGIKKSYTPNSMMRFNHINDEDIKRLNSHGLKTRDIAKILGCSVPLIAKRYRELGIRGLNKKKDKIILDDNRIRDLYNEGKTLSEVGRIIGTNGWAIKRRLINSGIKIRDSINHPAPLKKSQIDQIINLYQEGNSTYDIEKLTGLCYLRVFNTLKRNSIPLRKRGEALSLKWKRRDYYEKKNIKEQNGIIKSEYLKGTSIKEIISITKLSETTVHKRLKKMGINSDRFHPRGTRKRILCECGCGEIIWNLDNQRRFVKFKKGHKSLWIKKKLDKKLDYYKEKILQLYKQGHSTLSIGKMYGTTQNPINRFLRENNIPLTNVSTFGKCSIADDGHVVKSGQELYIDNWLFYNKIIHIYEKSIGYGKYKCDFFIPEINTYIEYFGMINYKKYASKIQKKINIYRKMELNLIKIFPKDNIEDKLNIILELIKQKKENNQDSRIVY